MRSFHVREFFETPRQQWRCLYNERFMLEFDNGEKLETITARVEVDRKLWMAHEYFDRLPILPGHHIGTGPLSNKRIQDVTSVITEDVDTIYGRGNYDREYLWLLTYRAFNRLYNEAVVEYSEYVRSVNSFDMCRLYEYPPLKAIRQQLRPTDKSMADCGKATLEILMTDPALRRNPIVSDLRAGLVKSEQLLQVLLVRGNNTDIDSHIYNRPIMGNYYAGITDPAEAAMDSTLAAKAIIFQGQPLEQTEYANRKLQFSSQRVDLLVMGDCRTPHLSSIPITKTRFRDMEGLTFLNPATGKQEPLRKHHWELVKDTTIQVRLAFDCHFREKGCICSTCYGLLANNIPYGANLGHIASVLTQSEVSQRVLKVKHSEASTEVKPITITAEQRRYILPGKLPTQIRLNDELKKRGIKLLLKAVATQQSFNGSKLPIVKKSDLVEGLSMAKYSQFMQVTFDVPTQNRQPMRYHITIGKGARMASLSLDFLRYFVKEGFTIQHDGNYHISLDGWDFSKPVFELPNKHANMKDFAGEVETFIRSTRDDSARHLGPLRQLKQYDDPVEALLDLHELMTQEVDAPFTHLAVVMLSLMVERDNPNNFNLPRAGVPVRFAKYDQILNNGSLGPLFAYQGGKKALESISQYLRKDRQVHLMDPVLCPVG